MALAYLLSPTFQIENSAGKPATGGYIEVYQAGSRNKYYCASDFDGTLLPFRIPLDSLGSNVVLAEDSGAYDVYVYNRYGSLLMSRYNVKAGSGGGGIGSLVSTDESIIITTTDTGATDIRTNTTPPSILRATAQNLSADGQFVFSEVERDGQNAVVDNNGRIIVNEGWWHYDAIARIRWPGNPEVNETQSISIYTRNNVSDSMTFDLSYAHSETVQVSGEYKATENGTQLVVGIAGMAPGMSVELVDFGVHSIVGEGAGGKYNAGEGIVIDEPNRVISVDFDEVQAKLTAGDGVTIDSNNEISVDTSVIQRALSPGNGISLDSDDNITVKVDGDSITFNGDGELQANFPAQVQSDWTEADSSDPSYIRNKPAETTLAAGSNITITESGSTLTIAATAAPQQQADWAQSDTTAVDYIKNKPNLARVALTGEYSDLAHTPHIPSTTSQLDNDSGFIAGDEVPRYQAHADWQASSSEAGYIYNKPFIPTETSDLHNDSGYITASDVPINQVQSDWTESDSLTPAYIQHKPEMKELVAGSNITITEASNTVTISASVPNVHVQDVQIDNVSVVNAQGIAEIPRQQNADWNSSAGASEILNKPDLSVYATNTALTNGLATKQDTISDLATIRSGAALGATSVQPGDLATVATTGSYSDLSGTPSIPVIGTVTL